MCDRVGKIKELANSLAMLVQFVPETKVDLQLWNRKAQQFENELLLGPHGLSAQLPHFLWHYLSDADIRMKDEEYAEVQNRRINLLLQHLNRGEIPSDEDTYVYEIVNTK